MIEPSNLSIQENSLNQQEEEDIEPRKRATMHILHKLGLLQDDTINQKQTSWEQLPVRKKLNTELKVGLRDYQQQALAFMCYREEDRECPVPGFVYVLPGLWLQTATATFRNAEPSRQQSKGGILGDEMGLGKTGRIKHSQSIIKLMSLQWRYHLLALFTQFHVLLKYADSCPDFTYTTAVKASAHKTKTWSTS